MTTPVAAFAQNGMLFGAFSFISTLIGSNPAVANFRGCGGLSGSDAAPGVPNTGETFVASITKTANAGEFKVTYKKGYRYFLHASGSVWAPEAGPGDEYRLQPHDPVNEGAGRETAVTQLFTIIDAAGAPVELDARRVSVFVVIKDSGSGA